MTESKVYHVVRKMTADERKTRDLTNPRVTYYLHVAQFFVRTDAEQYVQTHPGTWIHPDPR